MNNKKFILFVAFLSLFAQLVFSILDLKQFAIGACSNVAIFSCAYLIICEIEKAKNEILNSK